MNLLEIVARFVGDTKGIDQAIDATTSKAEAAGGRWTGAISKGLATGGKLLATGAGALFGLATKGAIDLQNATINFQAQTGATAAEAEAAGQSINRLFQNNLTTMAEASDVLAALKTNMGLTGDAAETAAGKILDYAKVTRQDAVGAVGALDDLTDTYNLTADQQNQVLDQLVASTQKYGGSVADNQAILAKLAPTLTAANLGYNDGIGLLNLFSAAGIDASKAPQALTKALSKVKSPAELQKLIDDIRATEDPFERAQKATDLFGAKAGPQLALALEKGGLEDFIVTADEAAGAVQTAADTIDSSIGNQMTLAFHKVGGALAGFGKELGPAVTGLASLGSLAAPLAKGLLGGLVPALAGLVPALATGISGLFAAAVPIAMAALPLLLVAGIIAAVVFLINNPEILGKIIEFVGGIVGAIGEAFGKVVEVIGQVGGQIVGAVGQAIGQVVGGFANMVGQVVGFILSIPGKVIGAWLGLVQQVATLYVQIGQKIAALVVQVVGFILSIPGKVASWVGSLIGQGAALASGVASRIAAGAGQVVSFILSIPGRVASWVGSIIGQAVRFVGQFISNVQRGVGVVVGLFLSIPGKVIGIGAEIVGGIIRGMASLPGKIADVIRSAFANLRIDIGPFHISGSGVTIDLPHIELPHFDVGARYIPQDMLAVVHKGEAIIPADQNPWQPGRDMAAAGEPLRAAVGGDGDRPNVDIKVFNPKPEPASTSVRRELQKVMVGLT